MMNNRLSFWLRVYFNYLRQNYTYKTRQSYNYTSAWSIMGNIYVIIWSIISIRLILYMKCKFRFTNWNLRRKVVKVGWSKVKSKNICKYIILTIYRIRFSVVLWDIFRSAKLKFAAVYNKYAIKTITILNEILGKLKI